MVVMRKLIYSFGVSLDGFMAGPAGEIDWSLVDEELHEFHNDQEREFGAHLYGRRLWETMRVWQTVEDDPSAPEYMREFSRIWKPAPKVVFSTTLPALEGNARLVREGAVEEVARLKEEPGGPLTVGGAGLASTLIQQGLVDEYRLFLNPVVLGRGRPFFPPLDDRISLALVDTRTFGSGVVYLRYATK
jgi:dihydrofolate reductase